jgi:UDP-N-acetyl-2-amino-2-deoxyglucuronate dehydrogenase
MKKFALLGAAGYVAPKHMEAIKINNGDIIAIMDPSDSVGIIDSYFPNAKYFSEIERFDRFVDKQRTTKDKIDYFSICTPNYLHDSHIRLALRSDADAICEKPLVINPKNLDYLLLLEKDTGRKINVILQLRYQDAIKDLKSSIIKNKKYDINLDYITSRGAWFQHSWKGNESKSGGLAANIGIHFFDSLVWIFGDYKSLYIKNYNEKTIEGFLELENANVNWRLSTDENLLPQHCIEKNIKAYREIKINNEVLEFSDKFKNLHVVSYHEILKGNGFGIEDTRRAIDVVFKIKNLCI